MYSCMSMCNPSIARQLVQPLQCKTTSEAPTVLDNKCSPYRAG